MKAHFQDIINLDMYIEKGEKEKNITRNNK